MPSRVRTLGAGCRREDLRPGHQWHNGAPGGQSSARAPDAARRNAAGGDFVTDAAGKFEYSASDLSTDSFYLLQANYQGVDYNTPVKFDDRGQARVDVTVYEATHSAPSIRIQSSRIILRAEGSTVHVQEMFAVRNSSNPPRSYTNSEGTFLFHLGKSNTAPTAAVTGLMEMPLPHRSIPAKARGITTFNTP